MELLIIHGIFVIASGVAAYRRNRCILGWVACALVLSWIALVILIYLPGLEGASPDLVKARQLLDRLRSKASEAKKQAAPRPVRPKKEAAKKKEAPRQKAPFRHPDGIHMYEKNAFQVLGMLPREATPDAVLQRESELTALLREGGVPDRVQIPGYCPVPWPECAPVTEAEVSAARSLLQDDRERVWEELFWFRVVGRDDEAYASLSEGDFETAASLWDAAQADGSRPAAAQALHNLAVLEHACVLSQEKGLGATPGLTSEQSARWKDLFALWVKVHLNDECWDYLKERVVSPGVRGVDVAQLRKAFPALVLKINLEIAISALRQEVLEYAKQHLSLIRGAGFSSEDTTPVVKEFFESFAADLAAIRQSLEGHPKNAERTELYGKFEASRHEARRTVTGEAIGMADAQKDDITALAPGAIDEYMPFIKKAREVKIRADFFDGCQHIGKELEDILAFPEERINKDFELALERFTLIYNDISTVANDLINRWHGMAGSADAPSERDEVKRLFEENVQKMRDARDSWRRCSVIAKKGREVFRMMEDLCCDEKRRRQIKGHIETVSKKMKEADSALAELDTKIGRNLGVMRQTA
jgi:hypothetical protein